MRCENLNKYLILPLPKDILLLNASFFGVLNVIIHDGIIVYISLYHKY